ncbi:hypothetical protein GT360_11095 [Vibrio astriarenae]|uniref:Uncharacterized protein n=1 Tax=Vibrio astriarenae TaxID=1481923 RepID=A0A7Z2T4A4_9VIBR|nr:hypothetical protein [Vibrio astriarenae]QIA64020.1 hypothetical protein GT360_11095 [Vibrio astriarenae]
MNKKTYSPKWPIDAFISINEIACAWLFVEYDIQEHDYDLVCWENHGDYCGNPAYRYAFNQIKQLVYQAAANNELEYTVYGEAPKQNETINTNHLTFSRSAIRTWLQAQYPHIKPKKYFPEIFATQESKDLKIKELESIIEEKNHCLSEAEKWWYKSQKEMQNLKDSLEHATNELALAKKHMTPDQRKLKSLNHQLAVLVRLLTKPSSAHETPPFQSQNKVIEAIQSDYCDVKVQGLGQRTLEKNIAFASEELDIALTQ